MSTPCASPPRMCLPGAPTSMASWVMAMQPQTYAAGLSPSRSCMMSWSLRWGRGAGRQAGSCTREASAAARQQQSCHGSSSSSTFPAAVGLSWAVAASTYGGVRLLASIAPVWVKTSPASLQQGDQLMLYQQLVGKRAMFSGLAVLLFVVAACRWFVVACTPSVSQLSRRCMHGATTAQGSWACQTGGTGGCQQDRHSSRTGTAAGTLWQQHGWTPAAAAQLTKSACSCCALVRNSISLSTWHCCAGVRCSG